MLDAGVAVIDGNLGSQGPVIRQPVGVDRGSAQPRLQRLNQAQVRGRQGEENVLVALSSRLQPSEPQHCTRMDGARLCIWHK
jgi:hypothetical protein